MSSYAPIIAHGKYKKGQIFACKRNSYLYGRVWDNSVSSQSKRLNGKQSLKKV